MSAPAGRGRRWAVRAAALACVAALAATAVWFVFLRGPASRTVVADFTRVEGVYPGSDVAVLGVPLGRVESVTPHGAAVRVTMTLRSDVRLPADVQAYVMNPSVIGARFVQLGPAYGGGPEYTDGTVIPTARTHAPINWDDLLGSLDTIADALGPGRGDVGGAVNSLAAATDGLGPALRRALDDISSATSLVGARAGDIGALIDDLDRIATAFGARQGRVGDLVRSLSLLGDELQRQDLDTAEPLARLRGLFDRLDALLAEHGDDASAALGDARAVAQRVADRPSGVAELLDLVPLALQNIGNAIGDDHRARLRLDVSSSGDQLAVTAEMCRRFPGPLCAAPGLTNPVPIPLSRSDPLGPLEGGR